MNEILWNKSIFEAQEIFGKDSGDFSSSEIEYVKKIYNNLISLQENNMKISKGSTLLKRFLESKVSSDKFLEMEIKSNRMSLKEDVQSTTDTPELNVPMVDKEDEKEPENVEILKINNDQTLKEDEDEEGFDLFDFDNLKEEEIETLSDEDPNKNLSPSDKEDILNGKVPEGFPDENFKEDTDVQSMDDVKSIIDEVPGKNLSPSDKEEILDGNTPEGFDVQNFKEDDIYSKDLDFMDDEIDICDNCGVEKELCICDEIEDDDTFIDNEVEEYGYIEDDEFESQISTGVIDEDGITID